MGLFVAGFLDGFVCLLYFKKNNKTKNNQKFKGKRFNKLKKVSEKFGNFGIR